MLIKYLRDSSQVRWYRARVQIDEFQRFEYSRLTTIIGATFLLTLWYKRYEVQSRMAVFYTAASLSGAFSGLLAFAIEKMDGIAGWYSYGDTYLRTS